MRRFKSYIQHQLNPLHVYCRLRDMGVDIPTAMRVTTLYERFLYRLCL